MTGRIGWYERAKGVYENLPLPPGQVGGVLAVLVLERIRPAPIRGSLVLRYAAGVAVLAAGCALSGWALVERRRRTSGEFDLEHPQSLVTSGPYALSRHPMYVGWWCIHLGAGLLRGSSWVGVTLPAAVLAEHAGVRAEDRVLAGEFGDEFATYRKNVPRYFAWRRHLAT